MGNLPGLFRIFSLWATIWMEISRPVRGIVWPKGPAGSRLWTFIKGLPERLSGNIKRPPRIWSRCRNGKRVVYDQLSKLRTFVGDWVTTHGMACHTWHFLSQMLNLGKVHSKYGGTEPVNCLVHCIVDLRKTKCTKAPQQPYQSMSWSLSWFFHGSLDRSVS